LLPPKFKVARFKGALPVLLMVVLAVPEAPTTAEKPMLLLPTPKMGAATAAVPDKATDCGSGATAPPVNVNPKLPLRAPAPLAACGVNCRVKVQLPLAGTLRLAQDSAVMLKSAALAPPKLLL
jgi:hypothetical protein